MLDGGRAGDSVEDATRQPGRGKICSEFLQERDICLLESSLADLVELLRDPQRLDALLQRPGTDGPKPAQKPCSLSSVVKVKGLDRRFAVRLAHVAPFWAAISFIFIIYCLDPNDTECHFRLFSNLTLVYEAEMRQQTQRTTHVVVARGLEGLHRVQ